jgi:hypothetical protein
MMREGETVVIKLVALCSGTRGNEAHVEVRDPTERDVLPLMLQVLL